MWNGILLIYEREFLPFETIWMDLDGFMLREVGLGGERQMPCDIIPMWNIKANKRQQKNWAKQTKQKQTCRYREESSGYERESGRVG